MIEISGETTGRPRDAGWCYLRIMGNPPDLGRYRRVVRALALGAGLAAGCSDGGESSDARPVDAALASDASPDGPLIAPDAAAHDAPIVVDAQPDSVVADAFVPMVVDGPLPPPDLPRRVA